MLTMEETQKVLDLRQRMYQNVQMGRPAHEGVTEEDYRLALDAVRSNRSAAAKAGEEKKVKSGQRKKKEVAPGTSATDDPKFAKFKNLNLD